MRAGWLGEVRAGWLGEVRAGWLGERESQSQIHGQKRRMSASSATAYVGFDCEFAFDTYT